MSKINCEILRQTLEKLPAPTRSGEIYIHKTDTRITQLQDILGIVVPNNDPVEYLSFVFEAQVYRGPSGSWLEWELLIE